MDGAIVLTRRDGTEKWQARFKIDGRWIRTTTKCKDLKEAKEAAKDLYMEAHYRKKIGVAARSKRFQDVAKLAIERMEKAHWCEPGQDVGYRPPFGAEHYRYKGLPQSPQAKHDRR